MRGIFDIFGLRGNNAGKADSILVTTGDGVVGHRVAYKLLAQGHKNVRVGVRDVSKAQKLKEQGADLIVFDFDKPSTFEPALSQVKCVYFAAPHHENWEAHFDEFLKVTQEKRISHVVKLSICHSFVSKHDPFSKVPLVKMQRVLDDKLAKSSVNYTILMASHFMSNPTVYQADLLRKEHRFIGASGYHGVAYVSPNDVADVVVRALLYPQDFKRRTVHLTGADVITDSQVAETLR